MEIYETRKFCKYCRIEITLTNANHEEACFNELAEYNYSKAKKYLSKNLKLVYVDKKAIKFKQKISDIKYESLSDYASLLQLYEKIDFIEINDVNILDFDRSISKTLEKIINRAKKIYVNENLLSRVAELICEHNIIEKLLVTGKTSYYKEAPEKILNMNKTIVHRYSPSGRMESFFQYYYSLEGPGYTTMPLMDVVC